LTDDDITDAEIIEDPVPPDPGATTSPRAASSSPFDLARRTARFTAGIGLLAVDSIGQVLSDAEKKDEKDDAPPALPPGNSYAAPEDEPRGAGAAIEAVGRVVGSIPPLAWARRRLKTEGDESREYAKSVIGSAAGAATDMAVEQTKKIDFDRISRDLELSRIVMQSTGGITGEAIDAVRAQAVGADALIDGVIAKVLRRRVERPPFELDR
jgi:hypothetical protein